MWDDILQVCQKDWYNCANDFQTAIAGLVGFAGVILTFLVNASIQRRQLASQRKHEQKVIKATIISELNLMRTVFENNAKGFSSGPEPSSGDILYPTMPLDELFKSTKHNLGMLNIAEIEAILKMYATYETFLASLSLLGSESCEHPKHVLIPGKMYENLQQMTQSFLPRMNETLCVLNSK
jgi:hypothetical protein